MPKKKKIKAKKPKKKTAKKVVVAAQVERFDRASYEIPVMALEEALGLADALLSVKPTKAASIAEDARRLSAARDRAKKIEDPDAKPFDVAMDRAWSTIVRRIRDHAELPVERHPEAITAATATAQAIASRAAPAVPCDAASTPNSVSDSSSR